MECFHSTPIDLVLLDVQMPDMDGLAVLRELRKYKGSVELPVMMLSGQVDGATIQTALREGANDYIVKPFSPPVLIAKVRFHIEQALPVGEVSGLETLAMPGAAAIRHKSRESGLRRSDVGPGVMLSGRYQVDEQIGAGGFGLVFKGTHQHLKRDVAIKVLKDRIGSDAEELARFQREGAMACRLQHPHAVSVFDFGVSPDGTPYLVMELLGGQSLRALLKEVKALTMQRALEIMHPVAGCLAAAARKQVIHGDLKPDNIHLHIDDGEEVVKLVDFGTAHLVAAHREDEELVGTPHYMAPELLAKPPVHGSAADIYAFGATLYEMLAGAPPFGREERLSEILMAHALTAPAKLEPLASGVSAELAALVQRCLAKKPEDRPTAVELFDHLGRLMLDAHAAA